MNELLPWWKTTVIYQIYPRSFQDTTGDGIGDIQGIIMRLPYLKSLGIGCIWLSPVYKSPNCDFGYDVSDYQSINPEYGTLDDMDELIDETHRYGMRIILDMVLNHTSDQHPWFLEAKKSKDNPYHDYYVWRDKPTNWKSCFAGNAFEYCPECGQYYLHSFLKEQPDLNWSNRKAEADILMQCRFWMNRGVDGFRLDVINCIGKDINFRNNPTIWGIHHLRAFDRQTHIFDRNRPETYKYIRDIHHLLQDYPDRMMVGEILTENGGEPEISASYLDGQLDLAFDFSLIGKKMNRKSWQKHAERWYKACGTNWPCWVLNNHDNERSIDIFGGDKKKAKLAIMFLMTQRGTPFIYYGEELAMGNVHLKKDMMKDPMGKKYYPFYKGRDGERAPMPWNMSPYFGFSNHQPWLPFTSDAESVSIAAEEKEYESVLSFYRQIIWLHDKDSILNSGRIKFISRKGDVMVYIRTLGGKNRLVLLNMSGGVRKIHAKIKKTLLVTFSSVSTEGGIVTLLPWQGGVFTV